MCLAQKVHMLFALFYRWPTVELTTRRREAKKQAIETNETTNVYGFFACMCMRVFVFSFRFGCVNLPVTRDSYRLIYTKVASKMASCALIQCSSRHNFFFLSLCFVVHIFHTHSLFPSASVRLIFISYFHQPH